MADENDQSLEQLPIDPIEKPTKTTEAVDQAAEARKWKSKYDGLQGYVQQVTTENNKLKGQLAESAQDYEGKITELRTSFETVNAQSKTTQQTNKELEQKVAKYELRDNTAKRVKVIAEEVNNPALIQLYEAELITGIETLNDDELKQRLTTAAQIISNAQQGAVDDAFKGATPPPPPGGQQPAITIEQLKHQMQQALTKGGRGGKEYQEAYRLYEAAILQPQK